jgi:hypothetical protein
MKEIEITDGTTTLKLTINKANVIAAMTRGDQQEKSKVEVDPIRWFARYYLFAACLACTSGEVIRDGESIPVLALSFDDYFAMSDTLAIPWLNAVYDINPHWVPPAPITEEEKKKA